MNGDGEAGPRGALFGVFLVVVGVGALLAISQTHTAHLGDNQDPGPRALPTVLAWCLILGGIAEVILTRRQRRRLAGAETTRQETPSPSSTGRSHLLDAVILLGALIAYIAVLPWIGFTASTLAFAGGMMWRLEIGWRLNLAVSLGLIAAIHGLFVIVFRVQLPTGIFGLPF